MPSPLNIYSEVELNTKVMSASRYQLIQMLLEKAIKHITFAKSCILNNDLLERNKSIRKANDIILHLNICLNFEAKEAVELAQILQTNYQFIEKCLLNTLVKNDAAYLDMATVVTNNIKEGWDGIRDLVEENK